MRMYAACPTLESGALTWLEFLVADQILQAQHGPGYVERAYSIAPEIYLNRKDRDAALGPIGDGMTYVPATMEEVALGVTGPEMYAVGPSWDSVDGQALCRFLAPYWARNLRRNALIDIEIARVGYWASMLRGELECHCLSGPNSTLDGLRMLLEAELERGKRI